MSDSNLFQLRDVDFDYPGQSVFKSLNLNIETGSSTAIIGPAACGKSTLLKLAVGLLRPRSGQVSFDNQLLSEQRREQRLAMARRVGMGFQNSGLFDSLTVIDNLRFGLREHTDLSASEINEISEQALKQVGLEGTGERMVHELSGGMQKRLGIARAFVLKPEVVLLDDPTAGLDPVTSRSIIELILNLKRTREMTLIVVTSAVPRAFEVGERVIMLSQGKIVADGPPEQLSSAKEGPVFRFLRGMS